MVDDILWEKGQRHFHILKPVEGCFEVHVLDVGTGKAGTLGADGTVPKEFQRDHVSDAGGEFERVVDKVTSSDTDTVRVLLLWAMVNYNSSIRYRSVAGDMSNFIVGEEKDGVGSFGDTRFALGKAMDFLAKCRYPEIFEVGIMLYFLVLCDCVLGNGMDNTKAAVLRVASVAQWP